MKKIGTLLLVCTFFVVAKAQYLTESLLFTQNFNLGSAKFSALSGAMGSVGGDYSATILNPAGLGLYRSSEYGISFGFENFSAKSDYLNTQAADNLFYSKIPNFHFVSSKFKIENQDKALKFFNIAVGMHKMSNYDSHVKISASDVDHSVTDYLAINANGNSYPGYYDAYYNEGINWESLTAYRSNMIVTLPTSDPDYAPDEYYSPLNAGDLMDHEAIIEKKANNREYSFSMAANYWNKIYIGASLNVQTYKHEETQFYQEFANELNTSYIDKIEYNKYFYITGLGLNLDVGIIYKPVPFFRIGAAYSSPSIINYKSQYQYRAITVYTYDTWNSSPVGSNNLLFVSSAKYLLSSSLFLRNIGFVSFDYELYDFSNMKYLDSDIEIDNLNTILKNYSKASSYKFGGEIRYKMMAIRGGYAMYINPKLAGSFDDEKTNSYSFGMGYKVGALTIDLAYMNSSSTNSSILFTSDQYSFERYNLDEKRSRIILSLNLRF